MNDFHFEAAASAFHRGVGALTSVAGNAFLSHFEFSGDSIIANRLSPAAVVSKRLTGDVGLPRGEGNYLDPQLCQQQIEIASSIISAPSLHHDSERCRLGATSLSKQWPNGFRREPSA